MSCGSGRDGLIGAITRLSQNTSKPSPILSRLALPTRLTASEKLRIASRLYATARKVKLAGIRQRHPDWSDERLISELNRRFFLLRD